MDLDADGNHDILSGSYSRMEGSMAGLFQVLRGTSDGKFKAAEALKGTDGEPLIIPNEGQDYVTESICTRPSAVDWDGDGDLDLVVGNFAGGFYLFTGEGKGKFAPKPERMKTGDEPLNLLSEEYAHAMHGDPFPIDWDGDGDVDLLSGTSAGGVQWAENTAGAKKAPVLKPFRHLIPPSKDQVDECRPEDVAVPSSSTRVWAADVNGDGKLDILVGDNISLVSPAEGVSEADFKKRRAEWEAEIAEVSKGWQKPDMSSEEMEALNERYQAVYQKRTEFMNEDRTGFVWLYIQK